MSAETSANANGGDSAEANVGFAYNSDGRRISNSSSSAGDMGARSGNGDSPGHQNGSSSGGPGVGANGDAGAEEREQWGNRTEFLFAAIGSAIGVGNILRFPVLVYRHGGLAFLVPYLLSLFVLGIPLLKLETGMGQLMQNGIVKGTAMVDGRMYGTGMMATLVSLIVAWYYSALMSWSWVYLVGSFADPLPWAGGFESAKDYFHESVLDRNASLYDGIGGCNYKIALGLLATWTCVYFCIWKGVKSMGMVLYVTIPLPFVLLFMLFLRGVTLPGAGEGLKFYMGRWDWSAFGDGSIYVEATSQIFFSLSLAQGIMQAYSSNNPKDSKYVSNASIIGIANSSASIFAGFALFSTLGYLSQETGVSIKELAEPGFDLGFITYPTAIAMFGTGWSQFFSILFFSTLLMLGIDSAFSLVEVLMSPLMDMSATCRRNRSVVSAVVCVALYLLSLIFSTKGGFWVLEIVDHYVISYAVLAVGILECLLMTFQYGLRRFDKELKAHCGESNSAVWFHSIQWFVPSVLGSLLLYNFVIEFMGEQSVALKAQPGWAIGIFGWIFCVVFPFAMLPIGFMKPWPGMKRSYIDRRGQEDGDLGDAGAFGGGSLASTDELARTRGGSDGDGMSDDDDHSTKHATGVASDRLGGAKEVELSAL